MNCQSPEMTCPWSQIQELLRDPGTSGSGEEEGCTGAAECRVTCGIGVNAMDLLVEGPAVVLGLKNG
jgi:hypothetical protein